MIYVDTDSVISKETSSEDSSLTESGLGDLKDELEKDNCIMCWVCGGPKSFCYVTQKRSIDFKHKGTPINMGNNDLFTFCTLQAMLKDREYVEKVMNPHQIFRIKGGWKIFSRDSSKIFRSTFNKREVLPNLETSPHGYSEVFKNSSAPFQLICSSASKEGKTFWITKLLKDKIVHPRPQEIYWIFCYESSISDDLRENLENNKFIWSTPGNIIDENFTDSKVPSLTVLDDQTQIYNEDIISLFTRGKNHLNKSVTVTVQNMFYQSTCMRAISLNAHFLIL